MKRPNYRAELIHERLGLLVPFEDYLAQLRQDGYSWDYIAWDIAVSTGVHVSAETLRRWHLAGQQAAS